MTTRPDRRQSAVAIEHPNLVPRLVWTSADDSVPLGTSGVALHYEYMLLVKVPGGGIIERSVPSREEAEQIGRALQRHGSLEILRRLTTDWGDDTPFLRTRVIVEEVEPNGSLEEKSSAVTVAMKSTDE